MSNKPETVPSRPGNGLANWRRRLAEDKKKQVAELDRLRENAVTVVKDGQEFRVVTIPDKYAWGR